MEGRTLDALEPRCAVLARALDEPLAGTAPAATRWVCLEHRGAWPRDVGAHPDPAVAAFAARAATMGLRLLLIRRPGRRDDGPAHLLLTDTMPGSSRTTALTAEGPADLAGLPLPGPGEPLPGATVSDPPLLICTHGRRDRCCALEGRALAVAVMEAGTADVWECSHLGGHRFAPTALVLPTGYLYGRLDAAAAIAAHKAALHGEVETALCRGRSTWSPTGQVAELAVRSAAGLRGADTLTVTDVPGGAVVTARGGGRWRVDVAAHDGPRPRPASCGADPVPFTALRATTVRPLV